MNATTTTGTAKLTLIGDDQFLITREFNAPKHLVYKAYTTPELVERWFGGDQGGTVTAEIDLRVGGRWRYVTTGDGWEVGFHGTYREIVPNERLVYTEVYEGIPDGEEQAAVVTATYTEVDGRTTLEVHVLHATPEGRAAHLESGMEPGMQSALDQLERVAVELA
jgi:uncharacterized protein YndB with AHSA1/START domain